MRYLYHFTFFLLCLCSGVIQIADAQPPIVVTAATEKELNQLPTPQTTIPVPNY